MFHEPHFVYRNNNTLAFDLVWFAFKKMKRKEGKRMIFVLFKKLCSQEKNKIITIRFYDLFFTISF